MKRLRIAVLVGLVGLCVAVVGGCDDDDGGCSTGTCYSVGGNWGEECYQGWTQEDCDDFDDQDVNGASWYFSCKSCDELGF